MLDDCLLYDVVWWNLVEVPLAVPNIKVAIFEVLIFTKVFNWEKLLCWPVIGKGTRVVEMIVIGTYTTVILTLGK